MIKSQIEPGPIIQSLIQGYTIETPKDLKKIGELVFKNLGFKPYNEKTAEEEKKIRWRRSAEEILSDGYVFNGKACTDLVIVFIAFCGALGASTNFVKVKRADGMVHSIAEVKIGTTWYICDAAHKDFVPIQGEVTKDSRYKNEWALWKKGRDAWDLGLDSYKTINKIK